MAARLSLAVPKPVAARLLPRQARCAAVVLECRRDWDHGALAVCGLLRRRPRVSSPVVHLQRQLHACAVPQAASAAGVVGEQAATQEDTVVQHVVVRGDLIKGLKWSLGSVMAQVSHASVAAVVSSLDQPHTQAYVAADSLATMHTVVCKAADEAALVALAAELEALGVRHSLWREQPENICTCLATAPMPRSLVPAPVRKLPLYRR